MRQKGYLSQHLNWDIAATEARQQLMFMNRDKVIAALRDAAPLYVAAHDAIRKLQCKRGKHPGMNERNLQAR
jgi:hypothetical protein